MNILLIGLLPLWGASAYFRCSDAVVRRYLVSATALMLGWMILVLVKSSTDFPWLTDYGSYLFYIPMIALPLAWLVMVARRGLRQSTFLLTLVVPLSIFLGVLYVQRTQDVFTSNTSLVFVILFVVVTEVSLRLGLLPSLSWSSETFRALPLDLRLISNANEDVTRTGNRAPLSSSQISQIFRGEGGDVTESDFSYLVFPVAGGHGVLVTDVSVLREQARELRDRQVALRSKNLLLQRDHEIQSRLAALQYEAQFLEDVEASLQSTSAQIQQLLEALVDVSGAEERAQLLERVRLLVSYSKARGRLVLAEHEGGMLTSEHLELLVAQSASDLRVAGIECALMHDLSGEVSTRVAALLYDCLFDFALASQNCINPVLLIHLSDKGDDGSVELRVAHGCDSVQVMDYKVREGTDNLITRLRGTFSVEGVPGALTLKVRVPTEAGGA